MVEPKQVFLVTYDAHFLMNADDFKQWIMNVLEAVDKLSDPYALIMINSEGIEIAGSETMPGTEKRSDEKAH